MIISGTIILSSMFFAYVLIKMGETSQGVILILGEVSILAGIFIFSGLKERDK